MAVIKIVPMPGAKGDKGDDGATGPQGPQGPIGPAGEPGTQVVAVPPNHHGSVGDTAGMISWDDDHFYVCVTNYTNGTPIIWKRMNWNSGNW